MSEYSNEEVLRKPPNFVPRAWTSITDLVLPSKKDKGPRAISSVSDLYHYPRISAGVFDLVVRCGRNFANWIEATFVGIEEGYFAFQGVRTKFRVAKRMKPPVHVSKSQASRDLKEGLSNNEIEWRKR
jgi:hypothetical protein